MRIAVVSLFCTVSLLFFSEISIAGDLENTGPFDKVFASDSAIALAAIEAIRRQGQEGVNQFHQAYSTMLTTKGRALPEKRHIHDALDGICAQRYCYASKLFWHTDLEAAKKQAATESKPILSLHLLGKLTDEYSCANSRYFRAILYSDSSVADYLRTSFVLHWQTVREVPKLTIDFGDGRVLKNTITGNSIHYVLDARGRAVDGIPGLYRPGKFLELLKNIQAMAVLAGYSDDGEARRKIVAGFHRKRLQAIDESWGIERSAALSKLPNIPEFPPSIADENKEIARYPTATDAAYRGNSKAFSEKPLIGALGRPYLQIAKASRMAIWHELAAHPRNEIQSETFNYELFGSFGIYKPPKYISLDGSPSVTFRRLIEVDTVRNEYQLHREIHKWLSEERVPMVLESLNRKVYAELFLTPLDDPWMGINPARNFPALENNGIVSFGEKTKKGLVANKSLN